MSIFFIRTWLTTLVGLLIILLLGGILYALTKSPIGLFIAVFFLAYDITDNLIHRAIYGRWPTETTYLADQASKKERGNG